MFAKALVTNKWSGLKAKSTLFCQNLADIKEFKDSNSSYAPKKKCVHIPSMYCKESIDSVIVILILKAFDCLTEKNPTLCDD